MNLLFLILGIVIGFFVAKLDSGKREGKDGSLRSLKIQIKKYTIHFHHWFVSALIILILTLLNFYNYFIYGILTGIIVQGLTYEDFYKLVYKNTSYKYESKEKYINL